MNWISRFRQSVSSPCRDSPLSIENGPVISPRGNYWLWLCWRDDLLRDSGLSDQQIIDLLNTAPF